MLWLDGVCCQRAGATALEGATLGVGAGELIVVEGATGAGKTTLLEVAALARIPDRGAVWFAGRNITSLQRGSLPYVRRNIGYAASEPIFIADQTVLGNIMLALAVRGDLPAAAEAAAREALTLVRAIDLADRTVASLSSGQKRLVALARAVAGPPAVVVADEPSARGGEEGRAIVVSALSAARSLGAAVLCGTSDSALADRLVRAGGRRIHLAQGHVVGAPAVELVPPVGATSVRREEPSSRVIALGAHRQDEARPPASKGPR